MSPILKLALIGFAVFAIKYGGRFFLRAVGRSYRNLTRVCVGALLVGTAWAQDVTPTPASDSENIRNGLFNDSGDTLSIQPQAGDPYLRQILMVNLGTFVVQVVSLGAIISVAVFGAKR